MVQASDPVNGSAQSFDAERAVRKHIGDYALFVAGMYPEAMASSTHGTLAETSHAEHAFSFERRIHADRAGGRHAIARHFEQLSPTVRGFRRARVGTFAGRHNGRQ